MAMKQETETINDFLSVTTIFSRHLPAYGFDFKHTTTSAYIYTEAIYNIYINVYNARTYVQYIYIYRQIDDMLLHGSTVRQAMKSFLVATYNFINIIICCEQTCGFLLYTYTYIKRREATKS